MQKKVLCAAALAAAALTACGGGGDADPVSALRDSYSGALAQPAATSSPDVFASNYMDAGMSRAALMDAMTKDAAALAASGDFSLAPAATLSDVSITNCNASGVCTLTGTLTNADADTTAVTFTTQVVLANGAYRVLGDQQSS